MELYENFFLSNEISILQQFTIFWIEIYLYFADLISDFWFSQQICFSLFSNYY